VFCFLLMMSLATAAQSQSQSGAITAIKAGRLIDPETGTATTNQIILIQGEKITAVGPNLAIPVGATVIDLSKLTVLPGLVDAHTHMALTYKDQPENNYYYLTVVMDSTALRAIQDRFRAGAVVGGTSAGAAVMSDSMITGNQFWPGMTVAVDSPSFSRITRGSIEIVPGLGFVHTAIVDQHFIRRQRENRLFSVVLERPSLLGVGIDEGTALKVTPDGKWTVMGRSSVMVLDARHSRVTQSQAGSLGAVGIRVSLLPSGSTYDPRTGEATLPPR
jgi:hypothetical protein